MSRGQWTLLLVFLALTGGWPGKGTMLLPADASSGKRLAFYASSPIWDRRDPFRLYFRKYRGHEKTDLWDLAVGNVETGAFETRRRFAGDIGLWPMSQDGEKLLVQEKLVGVDGNTTSRIWLMDRECNDGLELDPRGLVHQTWFTKLPDYSVEFEWEGQKPAGQYAIGTDDLRSSDRRVGGHDPQPNDWYLCGSAGRNRAPGGSGANGEAAAGQVPDAALGPRTTLVLQLEVPIPDTVALARRAYSMARRSTGSKPSAASSPPYMAAPFLPIRG